MIQSGLVSITFRKLTPAAIVGLVRQAGLAGIEWGGDIHVPHGDVARAREVRALTADAGLAVASYGSYYRVGETQDVAFAAVLETAQALGAPVIRVWAGKRGSAAADAAYRERVVRESAAAAALAATAGIGVAFEFHANTLTDTTASALDLLRAAAHPNLSTYWQPPAGMADAELDASLTAVCAHLAHLHVYHWDGGARRALAAGRARWVRWFRAVGAAVAAPARPRFAMLEFVCDDAPAQFLEDAATLTALLNEASNP